MRGFGERLSLDRALRYPMNRRLPGAERDTAGTAFPYKGPRFGSLLIDALFRGLGARP